MTSRKIAISPLPWLFKPETMTLDVSAPAVAQALSELRTAGGTAVDVMIDDTWTVQQYREVLTAHGMAIGPSYFSASFEDNDARAAMVESAKAKAEVLASLGVDTVFIGNDISPARFAAPTRSAEYSEDRTQVMAENLVAAADVFADAGINSGLHPHVGTWIEGEAETRQILALTQGTTLGFGPDTGHLAWAGMNPTSIITDYADRVVGVHLKDFSRSAADQGRATHAGYMAVAYELHVWRELGTGDVDIPAVLEALPESFDGWFLIEVDVPNVTSPQDSARLSLDYARSLSYFA